MCFKNKTKKYYHAHIEEEFADLLFYRHMIADNFNIDIDDIIRKKLVKNGEKYPVQKSKDSNKKYNKF